MNKSVTLIEKGSNVKKGTTIIEAEPFVAVLNKQFRKELCDYCFKSCKVSRCASCQYVYYCSRKCQKKSWLVHKTECPNIKKIHPRELPEAAQMMARIIIKLQNSENNKELGYYLPHQYRTFDDLMSHKAEIEQDVKKIEHFTTLVFVLSQFLPNEIIPTIKELFNIYCRMSINSFHVFDTGLRSIGMGLYLGPSIVDHSCRPNAVTIFEGSRLILRTLENITSFDWSKVFITYIDVMQDVDERRRELQSSYYFWCRCERCNNPEPYGTAAKCPNKSCTNPCSIKDLKCNECGEELSPTFADEFEVTRTLSIYHLDKKEEESNLEVCKMCLDQQKDLFHPLNIVHIRTLARAFSIAGKMEQWKDAALYGMQLLEKYKYYYTDIDPVIGTNYLSVARVLLYAGQSLQGLEVFRKASDLIRLGYGENHSKMEEVKNLADLIVDEGKRANSLPHV